MNSASSALRISVVEVDLPHGLEGLLPALNPSTAWIREGTGLIGLGTAASATARGNNRFTQLAQFWDSLLANSLGPTAEGADPAPLTAFVSATFSADSRYASHLVVPEILIRQGQPEAEGADHPGGTTRAATVLIAADSSGPDIQDVLARHGLQLRESGRGHSDDGRAQLLAIGDGCDLPATRIEPGAQTKRQHLSAVAAGLSAIEDRTVEKLVLARDVVVASDDPLPVGTILQRLAQTYPQTWTYWVGEVLGATPEMLVRVRGREVSSRVLAGTISRSDDASGLIRDDKQHREHELAVRSLLDGIGPLTESLQSPAEPGVLELPNVYHLVSDVTGTLAADESGKLPGALAVAEAAHPTAAVCGTPTTPAAQLIAQLEAADRGPYAGPVGWLDAAGNADFGIALRGGVLEDQHRLRLFAGGGVVAGSEPEIELAETEIKLAPMLTALGLS